MAVSGYCVDRGKCHWWQPAAGCFPCLNQCCMARSCFRESWLSIARAQSFIPNMYPVFIKLEFFWFSLFCFLYWWRTSWEWGNADTPSLSQGVLGALPPVQISIIPFDIGKTVYMEGRNTGFCRMSCCWSLMFLSARSPNGSVLGAMSLLMKYISFTDAYRYR